MKPLSERDENHGSVTSWDSKPHEVGMKPLSERDENFLNLNPYFEASKFGRNEATLWKRWELGDTIGMFLCLFVK